MSDSKHGPVKWVKTDKFVMPVIPPELTIDPRTLALVHCVSFLELSGDSTVDPDWAVEAMEHVAHYLQRLPAGEIARVRAELETIASHAESQRLDGRFVEFVRRFLEDAGVDDKT